MQIKKFDSINVIPFIDIMLVLLTIVLTTATFIAKGNIPLDLPQASAKESPPVKTIEISITKEGKIYLGTKEVSVDELRADLTKEEKKNTIIVQTDKESRFQSFIEVVDLLKNLGFESLSIVTKK